MRNIALGLLFAGLAAFILFGQFNCGETKDPLQIQVDSLNAVIAEQRIADSIRKESYEKKLQVAREKHIKDSSENAKLIQYSRKESQKTRELIAQINELKNIQDTGTLPDLYNELQTQAYQLTVTNDSLSKELEQCYQAASETISLFDDALAANNDVIERQWTQIKQYQDSIATYNLKAYQQSKLSKKQRRKQFWRDFFSGFVTGSAATTAGGALIK